MHRLYSKSRIYVVKWRWFFYSRYVKNWRHFMQIRRKRKEPNAGRW